MKLSLALGERRPLSRETAWGYFTTNLTLPGFGSLMAGYPVGYAQAALALGGLGLSMVSGAHFVMWYFANAARLRDPGGDPLTALLEMWHAVRLPLAGIALFGVGLLWAMLTSRKILRLAQPDTSKPVPPRLN